MQDLLLRHADARCNTCGRAPSHPGLCLVSGRLLCAAIRGCVDNKDGGAVHLHERCGGGSTSILSLRSTRMAVLMSGGRMAWIKGPYLDVHGRCAFVQCDHVCPCLPN